MNKHLKIAFATHRYNTPRKLPRPTRHQWHIKYSIDDTYTAMTRAFTRNMNIMTKISRIRFFFTSHQCRLDPSALDHNSLALTVLRPDPASTRPRGALDSTMCEPAFETATVCRKGKRIRSKETKHTHLRYFECKVCEMDPSEHVPTPRDAHTRHDSHHGSQNST